MQCDEEEEKSLSFLLVIFFFQLFSIFKKILTELFGQNGHKVVKQFVGIAVKNEEMTDRVAFRLSAEKQKFRNYFFPLSLPNFVEKKNRKMQSLPLRLLMKNR